MGSQEKTPPRGDQRREKGLEHILTWRAGVLANGSTDYKPPVKPKKSTSRDSGSS